MLDIFLEPLKLKKTFESLAWNTNSDNGFLYFNSPDKAIVTPIPEHKDQPSYRYYQDKALKILLYILNETETEENIYELADQINNPNYKFYNRIVLKSQYVNTAVPFELATNFPLKNIEAFRTYYTKKTKGKNALPIENFEFNHTQKGSFVIPISVKADDIDLGEMKFNNVPSKTHAFIKDYLDLIDTLVNISPNEEEYPNMIVEAGIDSRIVKDILGITNSIASYKNKYESSLDNLTISSKSNLLLDRKLSDELRRFKKIDLINCLPIKVDTLKRIEDIEVKKDNSTIYKTGAEIEAVVDAIDESGTAKFTVLKINNKEVESTFKATTTKLPKAILDFCADAFKSRDPIWIRGDIEKSKGKMGNILHEKFGNIANDKVTLFDYIAGNGDS